MFCSNCGTKNNDNAKFCISCGAVLNQSAVQIQEDKPSDFSSQIQNSMQYQKQSVQSKPYQKAVIGLTVSMIIIAGVMAGCIVGIII